MASGKGKVLNTKRKLRQFSEIRVPITGERSERILADLQNIMKVKILNVY